ncbi:hypothetical protein QDR00_24410 [Serratia ureilytica]
MVSRPLVRLRLLPASRVVSVWVRPLPFSCPLPALTPAETIQHPTLKITVVTNEASQEKLCETSQDRQDLGAYIILLVDFSIHQLNQQDKIYNGLMVHFYLKQQHILALM